MRLPSRDIRALTFVDDATLSEITLPWRQLAPLWRVGVALGAIVLLLVLHLGVRMQTARTTSEVRSLSLEIQQQRVAHEQLALEMAVKRGNGYLERAAQAYGLGPVALRGVAAEDLTP